MAVIRYIILSLLLTGAAHAISVNFVGTSTNTATGDLFLNTGTAGSSVFTDIGGLGFDIVITRGAANAVNTQDSNGVVNSVLEVSGSNTINVDFYETGTSQSTRIKITGTQFRFEDVFTAGDAISNFTTYDAFGAPTSLDFTNTSIFTPDTDTLGMTVSPTQFYYPSADPSPPGVLDPDRGMFVNLASTTLSGFSFTANGNSGDSFISGGLGNLNATPIPFSGSPLVGLVLIVGFFTWRVRRARQATG